MPQLCERSKCTGCSACASICPRQCIRMVPDKEGFLFPEIDAGQCIHCGLCSKTCPVLHFDSKTSEEAPRAYAAYHQESTVVEKSSSGGIFTALANQVIQAGGTVYGAVFDADLTVKHRRITDKDGLSLLRGSKYVQSEIGTSYTDVRTDLKSGKKVLFSGTPCQAAGLRNFLGKDSDNLLCVDIICHSVPSPKVWSQLLQEVQGRQKSAVISANFRDKEVDWRRYKLKFQFENGHELGFDSQSNIYMKAFIGGLSTRKSCYNCKFKGQTRGSDITIGDYWGVSASDPGAYHDRGTSLVLVQSVKGQAALDAVASHLNIQKTDANSALQSNPAYYVPSHGHPRRDRFFEQLGQVPMDQLTEQLLAPTRQDLLHDKFSHSLPVRALRKMRRILSKD